MFRFFLGDLMDSLNDFLGMHAITIKHIMLLECLSMTLGDFLDLAGV